MAAKAKPAVGPNPRPPAHPARRNTPSDGARTAAFEFLTQLAAELSKGPLNLPCFPDIVPRIRQALADPRSTPEDIVTLVGTEPRLAARLIQTAHSAIFNPTGKPLTDLRQAVTRLGTQLIQSVTLAFAVHQMKAEPTLRRVAQPLAELWERSLAVGSICQVLARRTRVPSEEAFLAGLLHGIGQFYIVVRAADAAGGPAGDAALADCAIDWHPSIGQAVLEKWGFNGTMAEAVGQQREHERTHRGEADLADILIAAVALAEARAEGRESLVRCAKIASVATLGLGPDELVVILRHTDHALESMRAALG
jgi:HD-like signal output (HDOD) protein